MYSYRKLSYFTLCKYRNKKPLYKLNSTLNCTEITQSRVILPVYACAQLRCDIKSYRAVSTLLTTAELILQDFRFQCLIPLCCSEGACSDHSYVSIVILLKLNLMCTFLG